MTGNAWIVVGIIAAGIAAFAIPYGFYLKSNQQPDITSSETILEKTMIKQETSGEQSPNIITGTTSEKGSIAQKSSGTQSPNIVSGGEGSSLQVMYDTLPRKKQNARKSEENDNSQK